jgi:hypothetical protein
MLYPIELWVPNDCHRGKRDCPSGRISLAIQPRHASVGKMVDGDNTEHPTGGRINFSPHDELAEKFRCNLR